MRRVARHLGVDFGAFDEEALYLALRRTAEGAPDAVEARLHEFAGSLLEGLVQLSPFGPGNEDVARHAVARFYEINGWSLDPEDQALHELVAEIAAARASVFAAAAILARRASRSS